MQFCPKCGAMMKTREKKGSEDVELVCPKCKHVESAEEDSFSTTQPQEKKSDIGVLDEKSAGLPETENDCPKCHNRKAYWWIEQTRSADEAPTRFYRCTKCRHTWREYS
ncbi:MAG: transcription factor S [archaeon]